eukprot:TRINITY_DN24852_c0_g1_i1.p1 TRINITY_DN24852_c0_g1~~TRINITY_DN24852_c0_g1_i1.p1  ORF type:complete len:456 (+),score=72.61 TRINITY_DN24852_c0_g1_i1:82-1449(+)
MPVPVGSRPTSPAVRSKPAAADGGGLFRGSQQQSAGSIRRSGRMNKSDLSMLKESNVAPDDMDIWGRPALSERRTRLAYCGNKSNDILRMGLEWSPTPNRTKRAVPGKTGNMTTVERENECPWSVQRGRGMQEQPSRRRWVDGQQRCQSPRLSRAEASRVALPGRYYDSVKEMRDPGWGHMPDPWEPPAVLNEEIVRKPSTHSIIVGSHYTVGHHAPSPAPSPVRGRSSSPASSSAGRYDGRRRCMSATGALNTSGGVSEARSRGLRRGIGAPDHVDMMRHPAPEGPHGGDEARSVGVARGRCSPTSAWLSGKVRDSGNILAHRAAEGCPGWETPRRKRAVDPGHSLFSSGFQAWEGNDHRNEQGRRSRRGSGTAAEHFAPYVPPQVQSRLEGRRRAQPWLDSVQTAEGMGSVRRHVNRTDLFGTCASPRGRSRSSPVAQRSTSTKTLADFCCGH